MMSRVSKRKISPTFGLLKSTLQKNIGIIILLSLAMLIFCPGFLLAVISKMTFRPQDYTSPDILHSVYAVTAISSCILVCIGNYVNFAYLYKKSASDVFGALPLTRSSLLFSRAAGAFISVLIPVTIGYIALAFLSIPYPAYAIGTVAQIASAYFMNILLMLAFSTFSLFFIICAGSGFDLAVSFFGFNIATFVISAIIQSLCSDNLAGYSDNSNGIMLALSPVYFLVNCGYLFSDKSYVISQSASEIWGVIRCAAVFTVLSVILHNYRKSERGEQAYAYKFIYIICGVFAGICGGYALSEIFIFGADAKRFSVIGFTAFAVGAVITTVVYGAVSERGFKSFKHSILVGGISICTYAVILAIVVSGAFGFSKRVPDIKNIKSASVTFDDVTVEYTDGKDITALHKAIIDKKAYDRTEDTVDTVDNPHTYIEIVYTLNGDKQLARSYYADKTKLKSELFTVYNSDERFEAIEKLAKSSYGKYQIEIWGDINIQGDDMLGLNGEMKISDFEHLIEVYRKELTTVGDKYFLYDTDKDTRADVTFSFEALDGVRHYETVRMQTTKDFPETNSILLSNYVIDYDMEEKQTVVDYVG